MKFSNMPEFSISDYDWAFEWSPNIIWALAFYCAPY
jgi:hypothetical protein